jgi:hypothetical protein
MSKPKQPKQTDKDIKEKQYFAERFVDIFEQASTCTIAMTFDNPDGVTIKSKSESLIFMAPKDICQVIGAIELLKQDVMINYMPSPESQLPLESIDDQDPDADGKIKFTH